MGDRRRKAKQGRERDKKNTVAQMAKKSRLDTGWTKRRKLEKEPKEQMK